MKKIMAIAAVALGLAGCNATATTVYRQPILNTYPTYYPLPSAYPNRYASHYNYNRRRQPICHNVLNYTPYGVRVQRVCN
jgi:hypothetical protein